MTTDATGDIWASTEQGLHRFKKDRQIWVPLPTALLTVENNIKAVAIDEIGSRRAIYIGSSRGLAVMRIVP
jgi:ligand-binding sensor domain-containing protein